MRKFDLIKNEWEKERLECTAWVLVELAKCGLTLKLQGMIEFNHWLREELDKGRTLDSMKKLGGPEVIAEFLGWTKKG